MAFDGPAIGIMDTSAYCYPLHVTRQSVSALEMYVFVCDYRVLYYKSTLRFSIGVTLLRAYFQKGPVKVTECECVSE